MRITRPTLASAVVALVGAGLVASIVSITGTAAHPYTPGWRIGDQVEVPVAAQDAVLVRSRASAQAAMRAVGIDAANWNTQRVANQLDNATEDITTATDSTGHAVATLTRDATHGALRSLVSYEDLGAPQGGDESKMLGIARRLMAALSVDDPGGSPAVDWDDTMSAWMVHWTRQIDGIPAPGDGLTVWVTPRQHLRALSNIMADVSRAPVSLGSRDALSRARSFMDGNSVARNAVLGEPVLEWQQPNNFLDPSLPDAPSAQLRLVWDIPYSIALADGESSAGALWVDAASGELDGGSEVG